MTSDQGPVRRREIPTDWDVVRDAIAGTEPDDRSDRLPEQGPASPPILNVLASSWADGVAVLAVCTAALVVLNAIGYRVTLSALPWAAILGATWWLAAAATLITIRQGTPGMLLAGIQFRDRIAPGRVAPVVAAAAVSALLLGLPGLLGPTRSPLALAGATTLEAAPTD